MTQLSAKDGRMDAAGESGRKWHRDPFQFAFVRGFGAAMETCKKAVLVIEHIILMVW